MIFWQVALIALVAAAAANVASLRAGERIVQANLRLPAASPEYERKLPRVPCLGTAP